MTNVAKMADIKSAADEVRYGGNEVSHILIFPKGKSLPHNSFYFLNFYYKYFYYKYFFRIFVLSLWNVITFLLLKYLFKIIIIHTLFFILVLYYLIKHFFLNNLFYNHILVTNVFNMADIKSAADEVRYGGNEVSHILIFPKGKNHFHTILYLSKFIFLK